MNNLKTAVINEMQKIFTMKKSKVFIGVLAVFPVILAILYFWVKDNLSVMVLSGGQFPLGTLDKAMMFIIPLFTLITTIELFCEDIPEASLLRPISRNMVYLSKIITAVLFSVIYLGVIFLVSSVMYVIILAAGIGFAGFIPIILKSFVTYMMAAFSMTAIIIITAFFTQLFKNSTAVIAFLLVAYVSLKVIAAVMPTISGISILSYLDWYNLDTIFIFNALISFTAILSYCIIFMTSGLYIFEQREY